jgi:hypothetical protein
MSSEGFADSTRRSNLDDDAITGPPTSFDGLSSSSESYKVDATSVTGTEHSTFLQLFYNTNVHFDSQIRSRKLSTPQDRLDNDLKLFVLTINKYFINISTFSL